MPSRRPAVLGSAPMGKSKKGKGRKRRPAITRRDPQAKATQAEQDAAAAEVDEGADDGAEDETDDETSSERPDAADDEASGGGDEQPRSGDDDEPSAGDSVAPSDASDPLDSEEDRHPVGLPGGADWAMPFVKLDHKWTWLETRLLFVCLLALTVVLCLWIAIRGMKEPLQAEIPAGTVFRALAGSLILGGIARAASRGRLDEKKRNLATAAAIAVGIFTAPLWRGVGIAYFEGLLDWLQEGSVLTLFGGLNGISTRLTMLVALIGGSLAAATGTHINIDVVVRLLPRVTRKPVGVLSMVATSAVCLAASWGTFDHIAITAYGAKIDASPTEKAAVVVDELGEMSFVWRKQVGFDFAALPWVVKGDRWNAEGRMTGRDWNSYVDEAGYVERYGAEKTAALRAPESDLDGPWQPFVVVPDHDTRGLLVHGMDLLWPLGFLMIGLRFLLRALLLVAGHVREGIEGEGEPETADASVSEEAA